MSDRPAHHALLIVTQAVVHRLEPVALQCMALGVRQNGAKPRALGFVAEADVADLPRRELTVEAWRVVDSDGLEVQAGAHAFLAHSAVGGQVGSLPADLDR